MIKNCANEYYIKGYCQRHYQQLYHYGKIFDRTRNDPNEIIIEGNVCTMFLYDKHNDIKAKTFFNTRHLEKVKKYKWCITSQNYVYHSSCNLKLHCLLFSVPENMVCDHKDRNKLNNLDSNFRICTNAENLRNREKSKNNTSGFKGVIKNRNKWRSVIRVNNELIQLGTFISKIEAARAYNLAAKKYHGEFAKLNRIAIRIVGRR